jgi:hypothetical protein
MENGLETPNKQFQKQKTGSSKALKRVQILKKA